MKILIDIPKEFEEHFNQDKFKDSIGRIAADVISQVYEENSISGNYEIELLDMLSEAFERAESVHSTCVLEGKSIYNDAPAQEGKWILEKHLNNDILRCSICNMDINCMEFGDYYKKHFLFCPFCGKAMSNETYGEFEFSTDDFFKSVLPRHHEPISERDSYNADF